MRLIRGMKKLAVFSLISIFLIQCSTDTTQDAVTLRVPVTIDDVVSGDIASYISLTGTLIPAEEMPVIAESGGFIRFSQGVLNNGVQVRKGQILATIENEEFLINNRLESKKLAKDHAVKDHAEKQRLGNMGGVPPREVEQAERSKLDTEASYQAALLEVEKLKVKAPLTGVITDMVNITEGQKVTQNQEIGKVMNYSFVRCELNITNDDIAKVKVGQEVNVTNFAYEEEIFTGRISQISPTIDATTRTFKAEVEIPNSESMLRPGMFVKADIVIERKSEVIRIPRYLVLTRNGKNIVFVVEDQVAKQREIELGLQDTEFTEVISGLELTERLVIRGFETLKDNTKVRVSR